MPPGTPTSYYRILQGTWNVLCFVKLRGVPEMGCSGCCFFLFFFLLLLLLVVVVAVVGGVLPRKITARRDRLILRFLDSDALATER